MHEQNIMRVVARVCLLCVIDTIVLFMLICVCFVVGVCVCVCLYVHTCTFAFVSCLLCVRIVYMISIYI